MDCPTCGRDSDGPETSFLAGPVAPVLDIAFLLCRIKCEACGTGFDRALWPVEPSVLSGVPESDAPEAAKGGAEGGSERQASSRNVIPWRTVSGVHSS